jgi:hypothetical protein
MERKDELDALRRLLERLKESEREHTEIEDLLKIVKERFGRKNPWDNLSEKEKKDYVSLLLKM